MSQHQTSSPHLKQNKTKSQEGQQKQKKQSQPQQRQQQTITTPKARDITDKTLSTVFHKKVCIRAKWPIRPELIPVSVA